MDHHFIQLHQLEHGTAEEKFEHVFGPLGLKFRKSTFSDNYRAWKHWKHGDGSGSDDLKAAVEAAYSPEGAWAPLVAAYKKITKNSVISS
jgi:hypothetical protein